MEPQDERDGSLFARIRNSLYASAGQIIFGMSDGAVSIFGLVLGVAVGVDSGSAVLLAGATGAIAASVSMMAEVFLDLESERDQAKVEAAKRLAGIRRDPEQAVSNFIRQLENAGLSPSCIVAVRADLEANPLQIPTLEHDITLNEELPEEKGSIGVHAFWMFLSDLIAGFTTVIPFAFLPLATARIVCIVLTAGLLLILGIGRARLGNRNMGRTILETMGIATAAALAGVIVGRLIS